VAEPKRGRVSEFERKAACLGFAFLFVTFSLAKQRKSNQMHAHVKPFKV
jgi:hypothetical protein